MINPKEFRIDDLVNYKGKVYKIVGIQKSHVYIQDEIKDCSVSRDYFVSKDNLELEPITLTEEWLLKFGFEVREGICKVATSTDNTDFILNDYYNKKWTLTDVSLNDYPPIKYIHQLQNLYFALTGDDITLNK